MQKLQKIFLVLALFGILVLLFVSSNFQPKQTFIGNITNSSIGQLVLVQGNIISLKEYNNKTFQVLVVKDNSGKIEVTSSSQTSLRKAINESKAYQVTGKVEVYNNTLQINSDKIEVLG